MLKMYRTKLFLIAAFLVPLKLIAQDYNFEQAKIINSVNIEGIEILDPNYIGSIIKSKVGEALNPRNLAEDTASIFRLGVADDIKVDLTELSGNKVDLVFHIVEKPRVSEIEFAGNENIDNATLEEKLSTKKFSILNSEKLKQDINGIIAQYREKKFNDVKVIYESIPTGKSRVKIKFNIFENYKNYITEINITGNKYFYSLDLKRRIQSQEIDCFSWANSSGTLDENRINNDLKILYQTYLDNGFIKIKLNKPRVRIYHYQGYSKAIVDLSIEEGPQYRVSKIDIEGADGEDLLEKKETILAMLGLQDGDIFNQSKYFADLAAVDNFYQDRGFAYDKIDPVTNIDEEKKELSIKYVVKKGWKVYINRVNIQGNQSTKDYVVRRELELQDSQLYRISKVQRSQNNLNRLGFFDPAAGVDFVRDENLDKSLDYDLKLKEALTGTLNLSLTYSENGGLGVSSQIAKRNFLGRGQSISLKVNSDGKQSHSASVNYTEPYFLDSNFSSVTSVQFSMYDSHNSDDQLNYKARSYDLAQTFGQPIWANWTLSYIFDYSVVNYSNISDDGLELLNFNTKTESKTLGLNLNYNTVNNPLYSSRGINFDIDYEFVGVLPGSNVRYDKFSLDSQYFKNLTDDDAIVFMAHYRFQRLFERENRIIPPNDRLFLGGILTLRGFDYASVMGANTDSELDPKFSETTLKNNNYELYKYYRLHEYGVTSSLFNFELLFPFSKDQSNIRGVLFYDAGNVWSEPNTYEISGAKLDYMYYKMSYGAGVRIITPAGVLRFEYANIINPRPRDNSGKLEFYIGSLF